MATKSSKKTTRVNLILPVLAKKELDTIADKQTKSLQDLIRYYIGRGLEIDAMVEEGARIIAECPSGEKIIIANPEKHRIQKIIG